MPLSVLLAGLKADAVAEESRLEAETSEEVVRIDAEAQSEARLLRDEALRAAEDGVRREAEAVRARARVAAAAAVRQARDESFHRCLDEARRRLDAIRSDSTYPTVLRALMREGLAALPTATVLRVDSRDEALAADLLAELGARLEIVGTLRTAGGVELARGLERVVRNTVEERLANAEQTLSLLFGRSDEGARR
jgi:vacuolar-type H+-ATPase subunit E/Vma4